MSEEGRKALRRVVKRRTGEPFFYVLMGRPGLSQHGRHTGSGDLHFLMGFCRLALYKYIEVGYSRSYLFYIYIRLFSCIINLYLNSYRIYGLIYIIDLDID